MKKSIILSAFVLAALTASAQTTVQGSKFTDNWSVELKTGIITPVSHSAFFKNARPALGIEFTKQLTPVSDWDSRHGIYKHLEQQDSFRCLRP